MKLKEDEVICDRCEYYEMSAGGCNETCHAYRFGSEHVKWMDAKYIHDRMFGDKTSCKGFKYIKKPKP